MTGPRGRTAPGICSVVTVWARAVLAMLGAAAGRERELWAGVNCWRFSALSILSPAMDYSALNLDSVAALGSTQAPWPEPVSPSTVQDLLFCLQKWGEAASCLPRDHQNMLRNLDCAPCLAASKRKDSESVRALLKQICPPTVFILHLRESFFIPYSPVGKPHVRGRCQLA